MRLRFAFVLLATLYLAGLRGDAYAGRQPRIQVEEKEPHTSHQAASVLPDTFVVADYTFDDSLGGPDTQGWVSVDLTAQPDTFFHVDDFASLGGQLQPLEGGQSLWCGAVEFPGCATCPGYGNDWIQSFESAAFVVSSGVTVDFLIRYDCEPGYDYAYLQYLSKSSEWQTLLTFTGKGDSLASAAVPTDSLDGAAKLRFHFESDREWSDEDGLWLTNGAVIIDSVTVSDSLGIVDFQDFELEPVGFPGTSDGNWWASVPPEFGDFAGLFAGTGVVQEDSLVFNSTHLWGFFNGSPDNYTCGGHPEQLVVPFTSHPGSQEPYHYIQNEVWSDYIDLSQDVGGVPVPDGPGGVLLEFDVYRDMPVDNLVFYTVNVRYLVDGEPTPWAGGGFYLGSGGAPDWFRANHDFTYATVLGATHIQVSLGVTDVCFVHCGGLGTGSCHSHAPLFDNVRLIRTVIAPIVVTNTNDAGPGSFRQAIIDADATSNRDEILFSIPGPGPHTILLQSDLPSVMSSVVIDGTSQPGYVGAPVIVIDGGGISAGLRGLHIQPDNCEIRGLKITNCRYQALWLLSSDNTVVEKNHIVDNFHSGVYLNASSNITVGGEDPNAGNVISGNMGIFSTGGWGIYIVGSGLGNRFLSNSIYDNARLGIDLQANFSDIGVTPNDPGDPDGGPNTFQNFPTVRWAGSATQSIGASLNSIPFTTFMIQFFANQSCDASSHGEGERYLGLTVVTTGVDGNVDFTYTTMAPFADGEFITATATSDNGGTSEFSDCFLATIVTGVDKPAAPPRYLLYQNVPNPFNPSTIIRYELSHAGQVTMRIYDVNGALVKVLENRDRQPGRYDVGWNGENDRGEQVSSGVYFYRLTAGKTTLTKKMVLLR